jgi:amino acid permease
VIAILKLLEARDATNARSYMELGTKAYGKKGKNTVGLFLILSQVGFTIAFVYFICS